MPGKIILVTGGARSGKSSFAEKYAKGLGTKVKTAYFATAQTDDEEMLARAKQHQDQRPKEWPTYETPLRAETELALAVNKFDVVLFDCLTIYTSNLLLSPALPPERSLRQQQILAEIDQLMKTAKKGQASVIFVTNEVGSGIVPENPLAREYRDVAGLVNQKAAGWADEVYLVVSGIAIKIK